MYEIITELRIDAPPGEVWAVLTNFSAYREWNRFMARVSGEARAGALLTLGFDIGGVVVPVSARVTHVEPERELRWRGPARGPAVLSKVASGEHYWQLAPACGGTRLIHGEIFRGALLPILWRLGRTRLAAIFERSNRELAARVAELRQP